MNGLLVLITFLQAGSAFIIPSRKRILPASCLFASSRGNIQRPPNEFSRTYRVERILSGGHRQRDYYVKVDANEDELTRLAARFDLNKIYSLGADLALRRERLSTTLSTPGVEVDGTVNARVTQVCVRTGEVFDVDVEFPLFAIVRPLAATGGVVENDLPPQLMEYEDRNKRKKRDRVKTQDLQEMDMMELQRLLQDFDVEDDVIEDEAIYSLNGVLDVGELVAQLFWLKLDPYPKKPGSNPVQSSISG
jgi:hypothetical protein